MVATRVAYTRQRMKGRRDTAPFHQIPTALVRSRCWWSLTPKAVKLFWDLYVQYSGRNNGDLSMTWSQMVARGWRSRDTLNRARHELLDHGLIIQSRQGGKHFPSLYAVSIREIDECGGKHDLQPTKVPPHDWKEWRPDNRIDSAR
jgi:hypothetical protein